MFANVFRSRWGGRWALMVTCTALAACGISRAQTTGQPVGSSSDPKLKQAIAAARDRVFPAVVSIVVVREDHIQGRRRLTRAGGSGTIVSKEGYIVTNDHVAQDGTRFRVILADKRETDAKLVGEDPLSDIAVLKIDPQSIGDAPLPVGQFGDSDQIEIGDYVLAIGSPWGMSGSMSLGIVNNNERLLSSFFEDDADYEAQLDRDQPTGSYYRWIQHDAAIAPGNSGGPLVNLRGEVIGVNTRGAFFGGDMAYASPSSVVRKVVADLVEHGEVIRSFIGLQFKPVKTTGYKTGVLINSVVQDSPADRAGLRPGDVVIAVDGEPVFVWTAEQLPGFRRRLSDLPVGTELVVSYERDGNRFETKLATTKYEKDVGERLAIKPWGMTVQDLTPRMARNRRLANDDGVLVTGVEVGGPGKDAKPALQAGDVLHAVAGREVKSLADLKQVRDALKHSSPRTASVLLDFEREGGRYVAILQPREDEEDERPTEVDKAWIGVEVQPVFGELADQLGLEGMRGFRIARVYANTLAAEVDLRVGDLITGLDGVALKPRSYKDAGLLQRRVKQLDLDGEATLTVWREGQSVTTVLGLQRTPQRPDEAPREKDRDFDFEARDITFFDRANKRWRPDTKGVLVTRVESGGWAGVGHLRVGDLITMVNDAVIEDIPTFRRAMAELRERHPAKVRMLVLRGIETRFLFIEPDWDDQAD